MRNFFKTLQTLSNPTRFSALATKIVPWLAGATAIFFGVGLYGAWFSAPSDYQQGETIRILYIHVPAAWSALFIYASMGMAALGTLIWRLLLRFYV
jgi:heme exporter protein C